jgi:hypothetical protein
MIPMAELRPSFGREVDGSSAAIRLPLIIRPSGPGMAVTRQGVREAHIPLFSLRIAGYR